jgi:hypothetical protein
VKTTVAVAVLVALMVFQAKLAPLTAMMAVGMGVRLAVVVGHTVLTIIRMGLPVVALEAQSASFTPVTRANSRQLM